MTEQVARLLEAVQGWAEDAAHEGSGTGCTWCPVCQAAERLRTTSPEVRTHLTSATTSLLQGAASLLEAVAEHQRAKDADS